MITVQPSGCKEVVLDTDGAMMMFVLLTVVESKETGDVMLIV
jgi:hypothetical protein